MMRDDLLLYHLFMTPKHMPRTVQLRICITSIIPYLLIRVFITNGPLQVIITCVCERDQEEEKHDRMTGSRSSGKTEKRDHQRKA